jgi:predicted dehydrogenase
MAMSVAEAEEMIEAGEGTGRNSMIAHMWRFDREVL